jgi:bacterioferritin-associated ferredoxin
MTVGALQIMLKSAAAVPEDDVVLAGTGPLLYLYGTQCLNAGVKRLTILDTRPQQALRRAIIKLPSALRGKGPRYLWKGINLLWQLQRPGVRIHQHVRHIAIEGVDHVTGISFETSRGRMRHAAKLVALHEGVVPNTQLTRSIGCSHVWDKANHAFRPELTEQGETTEGRVYVVGDAGSIMGAAASALDGELAALEIAARLKALAVDDRSRAASRLTDLKQRELAVRPFINEVYHPKEATAHLSDETILCRCEALRTAEIRDAIRAGASGADQVKAYTRSGMGPCQGRLCGPSVNSLLAREKQVSEADAGYYSIRSPIVPVSSAFFANYLKRTAADDGR